MQILNYQKCLKKIADKASRNLTLLESDDISSHLLTSEWLFNNIGDIAGFDNTFICFGYFKTVEVLLSTVLLRDYQGESINISSHSVVPLYPENKEKLMLGNMISFATNSKNQTYTTPHIVH